MTAITNNTIYKCPVCGGMLFRCAEQYACKNRHSFDIAKEGYVNLLYPAKRNTEQGDSKEMVLARRAFLNKGHYRKLSDELARVVGGVAEGKDFTLTDSGCGEGYYLNRIADALAFRNDAGVSLYGFDLSKSAIKLAAKSSKAINFAVANVFKLPVLDKSVDVALSVFSPFNEDEISRVVKDRGLWVVVTPGEYHLFELKSKLYDSVALNDGAFPLKHFKVLEKVDLRYCIAIKENEAIRDLVKMTPYYWKTSRSKVESFIKNITALHTRVEFEITVCRSI